MLDPPPMIEFLKLRANSVRTKGRHTLKWGTCCYSNTEQQYTVVANAMTKKVNEQDTKRYVDCEWQTKSAHTSMLSAQDTTESRVP